VLAYLSEPGNLRPSLLPALLDNPAVPEECVVALCATASQIMARVLLGHERVRASRATLEVLVANSRITPEQAKEANELLGEKTPSCASSGDQNGEAEPDRGIASQDSETPEPDEDMVEQFLAQHAKDIAAEEDKPFTMVGMSDHEQVALNSMGTPQTSADQATLAAVRLAKLAEEQESEKVSTIQKISRLTVGLRVQLAMKGNRDERSILIRDGARIVSSAVLESPKLTDAEVDAFAALKNVGENVLRGIGTKRKFLKRYSVIRTLTNNPKTPVDLALHLVPRLMVNDLKNLCRNRDVSETIVKLAVKLFRERTNAK
jgi:hypothetical protein